MTQAKPKYLKFYPWIKWILTLFSLIFFALVINDMEKGDWLTIFEKANEEWILTACIIVLAVTNWSFEALKFRTLIASAKDLSFKQSFLIILGGMAVSNFSPGRTLEYVGRGLLLKEVHPIKVIIATITGNLAQVILTYSVGLLAIVFYLLSGQSGLGDLEMDTATVVWGAIAFIVVVLIIAYGKKLVRFIQSRLPKKIKKTLSIIEHYNRHLFLKVLRFASFRYLAFTLQFFLLLYLFGDQQVPLVFLFLVPIAYLLQSLVPIPAVGDIGVRVYVSTLLFGVILTQTQITQAVTSLWFINLIVPGIIGTIYLLTTIRMRE